MQLYFFETKLTNLKLKTQPKQLVGSLPLVIVLPDPTDWLDGARPANTCIPPSFPGNTPAQPCGIPNPKSYFIIEQHDMKNVNN